jgi:ATP-dependent Clp protease ATP-binding subunit ClpC
LRQVTLRLDAFDADARRIVAGAQRLADERRHREVTALHVGYELVDQVPLVQEALEKIGVDPVDLIVETETALRRLPSAADQSEAYLSRKALELLKRAELEANRRGSELASTRDLAMACVLEEDPLVRGVLAGVGTTATKLRESLTELSPMTQPKRGSRPNTVLDAYGRDLTKVAAEGGFDPFVGREDELQRMLQVMARREENNPLLVGEAGTGRTALVEALAAQIASGEVPDMLAGRRIVTLDSGALVAGTRLRGELEQRMRSILDAVRKSDGGVILFIPNLASFLRGRGGAADMLATALGHGEVRALARCTPDELREIEDGASALSRRFVPIHIDPPNAEEALEILRGVRSRFEDAHEVHISDEALEAAVKFARRYVGARELPKSAIDLVDESAARVQLGLGGSPDDRVVGAEDVAEVVSLWTGVPAAKMLEEEAEKLLRMEERLRERVVGQDHAISALSKAVRRGRVGLRDPKRPIGSFLFLGPTGVGKTELAKALAEFLFDDEGALTRLDMSEFMEKHMVARLIGAPPGYVDSDEGGFLTEAVRRRPYSVVLFDEIEKAHPDVFNVLLQVLEDGRLTDSRGRVADFRDTVILMTSNVGSDLILDHEGTDEDLHDEIDARLHQTFRPEFLNRIDEVLVFERLGTDALSLILDIQLEQLRALLHAQGLALEVSDEAKARLVELGYEPAFGARPLKRVLVRELQDPLAEALLRREFEPGRTVVVDFDGASFSIAQA